VRSLLLELVIRAVLLLAKGSRVGVKEAIIEAQVHVGGHGGAHLVAVHLAVAEGVVFLHLIL